MKRMLMVVLVCVFTIVAVTSAFAAEEASEAVVRLANTELVKLGTDAVIVSAVKAENAKGKSLQQIKELDAKWKATPGIADYMKVMMQSKCGQHLQGIQSSVGYYAELFVMDNLGGNVCMSDKTSDYWQGDEAKFQKSFNNGKGAVHIGKVKFDDSTQAYLVQVSVPVRDGDKVIGAITIGIDVDKIE